MQPTRSWLVVGPAALAVSLAGCGGRSGSTTPATGSTRTTESTTATAETTTTTAASTSTAPAAQATTMRIVIVGGVPKGGIVRTTAKKGDRVVVLVTSDVSDEVHVHGYDLKAEVAPGKPARIAFVANLAGRFDVELESRSLQIGDLTVR